MNIMVVLTIHTRNNYHADMALTANINEEMTGGIMLVQDGEVLDSLSLPFAGLLSPDPVEYVAMELEGLHGIIKEMGCMLQAPS